MFHTRFSLAQSNDTLALPDDGRIAVFGPTPETDLSVLPKARVEIIAPDFPVHEYWRAKGWTVVNNPSGLGTSDSAAQDGADPYAAAVICVPRAKALAQAWVAAAAQHVNDGLIVVDGQKTDGIDSLLKAVKKRASVEAVLSKAHGKIIWLRNAQVADWHAADQQLEGEFITRPGVFSADGIDKGSNALIQALPQTLKGRVADLGAGWGYLSRHILTQEAVEHLDLIESNATALDCARANLSDPRAHFLWGDATSYLAKAPYDAVISNPPFHTRRKGDPDLGRAFIRTAAKILKGSGQFIMVANRHLPYEDTLAQYFREVEEIGGTSGFKVVRAAKPNTSSSAKSGRAPR